MTVEQVLAGAMGCASWRVRHRLREYAELAPEGGIIRGGSRHAPRIAVPSALGLNEVGVTDAVMATMWRVGPHAAAYAVSAGAEFNHVGADIAIVHSATTRVLLYQAKLAHVDADRFVLKSKVGAGQARLLTRRTVTLDGVSHAVTGRLALYQTDRTPFLGRCRHVSWFEDWGWERRRRTDVFAPDPESGRRYYDEALHRCHCSPSGIVAAPVDCRDALTSVSVSTTWPWEFDIYEWFKGNSPLDSLRWLRSSTGEAADRAGLEERTPQFEPYRPATAREPALGAQPIAQQLSSQLRLPARQQLYVIQI